MDERKLATVVFADLVGSTALAHDEDPERVRAVQDRFFDAMAEEIERRGGVVEKYVGVGAYLFAAVLERFFALHATVNAFTQTSARLRGADAPFKTWPPRAGEVPLL